MINTSLEEMRCGGEGLLALHFCLSHPIREFNLSAFQACCALAFTANYGANKLMIDNTHHFPASSTTTNGNTAVTSEVLKERPAEQISRYGSLPSHCFPYQALQAYQTG